MKTRYTSLVQVKKNIMQKSEKVVQESNANLDRATAALEVSFQELNDIPTIDSGKISDFLSTRSLLDSQRNVIRKNEEWVLYAQSEIKNAKEQLKLDMIEYEKFNYLELQEIEKILHQKKLQESKDLDEIALMTYEKKNKK